MRQFFSRDQMTKKLTTIGHLTAFNNEQSPYCIVCLPTFWTQYTVKKYNKFVLESIFLKSVIFCTNEFHNSCALDIILKFSPKFRTQIKSLTLYSFNKKIHVFLIIKICVMQQFAFLETIGGSRGGPGGPRPPFRGKNLVDYIGNHWSMTWAGPLLGQSAGPP